MKKIALIFLLINSIAFSQTEKALGTFNKITSFDQIDVLLIPSTENKVILVGENHEEVLLEISNGELKIKLPIGKLLKGDNISATVYFKKIDALEANEGSRIACNDEINAIGFDIITKEGSQVNLQNLVAQKLAIRCSAGSEVTIAGKVVNQEIIANAGAKYYGQKCLTSQTTVTTNAGGIADVYATDFVDAKTRAGGTITIYGTPKQINEKKVAGGTITQVK